MIIPPDTPYRVLKLLNTLNLDSEAQEKYSDDKFLIHLKDRGYIKSASGKFKSTAKFIDLYAQEISPTYLKIKKFVDSHDLVKLETYYLVSDFEGLISVANDKNDILQNELSFQQILSKYFNSSKHSALNSNLSDALKTILSISEFPEESKNFQFLSILYPIEKSRCIILCENMNRLKMPRHRFVEFWYAGGRNTIQMQYIPITALPVYYLFDWDHDGVSIYLHIKQNYIPSLKSFIPSNHEKYMVKQEEVKHHLSKWKDGSKTLLPFLTSLEKSIVEKLIKQDRIIEEQKILLTSENLNFNGVN